MSQLVGGRRGGRLASFWLGRRGGLVFVEMGGKGSGYYSFVPSSLGVRWVGWAAEVMVFWSSAVFLFWTRFGFYAFGVGHGYGDEARGCRQWCTVND